MVDDALPDDLRPMLACPHCKLQRWAQLAPACVDHISNLLAGLRHFDGTMQELEAAIDHAMWWEAPHGR